MPVNLRKYGVDTLEEFFAHGLPAGVTDEAVRLLSWPEAFTHEVHKVIKRTGRRQLTEAFCDNDADEGRVPVEILQHYSSEPYWEVALPPNASHRLAMPLLIWLHDEGQSTSVLSKIAQHFGDTFLGIAIRGPCPGLDESTGYEWCLSDRGIEQAEVHVNAGFKAAIAKYCVDQFQVFIGGEGSGGSVALHLGIRNPKMFKGLISIGGPFPENAKKSIGGKLGGRPSLFIAYGQESDRFPSDSISELLRYLRTMGFDACIRQYAIGDEHPAVQFEDARTWVNELIQQPAMPEGRPAIVRLVSALIPTKLE